MLIVNADDWGKTRLCTDAISSCYDAGRVTSVSAMVFMEDSERAAGIAKEKEMAVGLHINLSERYSGAVHHEAECAQHRVVRFFLASKYAVLVYNPFIRKEIRAVVDQQIDEFRRLYHCAPTHFDGHQHMHLAANLLVDPILPKGAKVRRSFSFRSGEKSALNRWYRSMVDRRLRQRYRTTDSFFALSYCLHAGSVRQVLETSRGECAELMTHPHEGREFAFLMGGEYTSLLQDVQLGSYRDV